MNLLMTYDSRHIRVFHSQSDFISFSHYEDNLLKIADYLFASNSTIKTSYTQINHLNHFVHTLKQKKSVLTISSTPTEFLFVYQHKNINTMTIISTIDIQHWSHQFKKSAHMFSITEELKLPHQGMRILIKFLEHIGIRIFDIEGILEVHYHDEFIFIPFEFLHKIIYIKMFIKSHPKKSNHQLITSAMIAFDPDLSTSYEESHLILKLLKKRNIYWKNKDPDLILISGHGNTESHTSYLENSELESIVRDQNPSVIVFNSCILAQQNQGVIQHFLDKGTIVIASPFHTLSHKTVFSPFLRFLKDSSDEGIWTTFQLLKIFYPNIYKYFRVLLPTDFK